MKSQPGPPMTLGNAANAKVRLIVWCKARQHQLEPDAAEMARTPQASIGASGSSALSAVGLEVDFVVTGTAGL